MSETFIISENRLFAPVRVQEVGGYAHIDTGASFSHGVPIFSVALGGRTVNAAFDTGAGMSVLDRQLREGFQRWGSCSVLTP